MPPADCVRRLPFILLLTCAPAAAQLDPPGSWAGLAGGPSRPGSVRAPLPSTDEPAWSRSTDADGNPITFVWQAPTAVSESLVFAAGRVGTQSRLMAFARDTGEPVWWAPVATPVLDSISGPALDAREGTVIFASQRFVTAFDQRSGAVRWQAELARVVVNASPLVVSEPGRPGRVFITDFDGFGLAASVYCLDGATGEVLWAAPIGGSSGNTPAYLELARGGLGLVYVATSSGQVLAFDAFALTAPPPAFTFNNVIPEGFFGGLTVVPPAMNGEPPALLAASYAFSGGMDAANLVKLDGATGALLWSVPCNRTQSIPVALPGGRVALSTGILGFGTVPSVQVFMDQGAAATLAWDSALGTWTDLNGNGLLDAGEFLEVGGWTQQPLVSTFAGRTTLTVGLIPPSATFSTPGNDLYTLDLDGGHVIAHATGVGGSPGAASTGLASIGAQGLVWFGPTPATLDRDGDGLVTIDDLYAEADGALLTSLRAPEAAAMIGGRP